MNTEKDFEKVRTTISNFKNDGVVLTDENILRILESYKEKRIYDKARYDEKKMILYINKKIESMLLTGLRIIKRDIINLNKILVIDVNYKQN